MDETEYVCVQDFERAAARRMKPEQYAYYAARAIGGMATKEVCHAYESWRFRPRLLQDVATVNISTSIAGSKIKFPICIAPTAFQQKAHPKGEVATAAAAEALGTGFALSMIATRSMEEVAREAPLCIRWCQLFILKNRDVVRHYINRAEKNGFSAFIVTLDTPVIGKKRYLTPDGTNVRVLHEYRAGNVEESVKHWYPDDDAETVATRLLDPKLTWEGITWLKGVTKLPVIVKGILTAEMAQEALKYDIDGIIVSNHGGRQLGGTFASIDALPEVVKAVNGRCDVFMDGGIRNGSDVVKALALGAKAVFIGRPALWGLACGGEDGVKRVLEILRDEMVLTMQLLGVSSIEQLQATPNLVVHESRMLSKL